MKKIILLFLFLISGVQAQTFQVNNLNAAGNVTANAFVGSVNSLTYNEGGTGAVDITQRAKNQQIINAKDFGALCDGSTDDTTAFQNALAVATVLIVPSGTCNVSGTLTLSLPTAKLIGQGRGSSILRQTTAATPLIAISSGVVNAQISDLTLTRSVTATFGGDGIDQFSTIGQALLSNLTIQYQYVGANLTATDYSTFQNSVTQYNQAVGVLIENTSTNGACQWQLNNILSQFNGAQGFLAQSVAGVSGVTLGTWTNLATYQNSGTGIGISGSSGVPINDVRIIGGFFGNDGNSEIYLNSYGAQNMISDVFVELAGTSVTGPTGSTAASHIGSGIEVTSNNTNVQITNAHSDSNSLDGYYTSAFVSITGSTATNNGQAGTSGRQNGVDGVGNPTIITGGYFGNTASGTTQQYGAFVSNGINLSVIGANLSNNTTGTTSATINSGSITQYIPGVALTSTVAANLSITGGSWAGTTLAPTSTITRAVPDNVSAAIPTIASASTVTPATPIVFISGTSAIATIAPPAGCTHGCTINILPTGLFTTTTAGNIALASSAVLYKQLIMTYDVTGGKWYPSY